MNVKSILNKKRRAQRQCCEDEGVIRNGERKNKRLRSFLFRLSDSLADGVRRRAPAAPPLRRESA